MVLNVSAASSSPAGTPSASAIIDWLAEVGARWGLPADACRVHGLLYLLARPLSVTVIAADLSLSSAEVDTALAWLAAEELVEQNADGWFTQSDPWLLMLGTLERRRQRELEPALAILAPWRQVGAADPVVGRQARRLLDLVEDLAAIDAGAQRLSPHMLRRMIGIGGRAGRFLRGRGRGRA